MKKEVKGFTIGVIATALLFSMAITVFAKPIKKVVTAVYNDIKIYVDGNPIQPKDANGNKVEPFVYNGTTYLPVRAVSQALGKNIRWEDATKSIYIGECPEYKYMSDIIKPFEISASGKCEVNSNMEVDGLAYNKGYRIYAINSGECLVKFNLEGKYSDISGVLGLDSKAKSGFVTVEIYGDGKIIEEYQFDNWINYAKVNWNVTGIKELAVKAYGIINGNSQLDLVDLILKPNVNLPQDTNNPAPNNQLTSDNVTVKMSAVVDLIGVLIAFPEGVTDVVVTDVSKSSGKFKPFTIKKYEYNFFNRVGTQEGIASQGLEYFKEGEELELTIEYTSDGIKKTTVITKKILPAW